MSKALTVAPKNKLEPVQSLEAKSDRIIANGKPWVDKDFPAELNSLFDSSSEYE